MNKISFAQFIYLFTIQLIVQLFFFDKN